ncbi:aldo/keto reductase [Sphingomonas segetis]|jgi:aryl-alcohol dehydrogenase-like predicted oxidoreductase|uniref:aldo/keto reductase n=1 Tax=Sphingomonas segetis TaxID=1104779 RepID=UPI0018AD5CCC
MAKRRIGSSELVIAPLVLGGNVFGWTADQATSFRILDEFVDRGGTMIDTADVYSYWVEGHQGGESESVIGRWLMRDPGKRTKVQIATKAGFNEGLAPQVVKRACDASLQRLGIDSIDLYYQHKDDPSVPLADSLGAFDALKRAGKIRAVGFSQFSAERLDEAMNLAASEGLQRPCALQTWYNLVEREKLEGPLRDVALRHGLGILPFYGLANGFLTGKYRTRDDLAKSIRGNRVEQYLEGRGMRVLHALDAIAAETGSAVGTVALAWVLAQPGIVGALASATSVEQLSENMAALTLELRRAHIDRLNDASAASAAADA